MKANECERIVEEKEETATNASPAISITHSLLMDDRGIPVQPMSRKRWFILAAVLLAFLIIGSLALQSVPSKQNPKRKEKLSSPKQGEKKDRPKNPRKKVKG